MKRTIAIILALSLLTILASCGSSAPETLPDSSGETASAGRETVGKTAETAETTTTGETEEETMTNPQTPTAAKLLYMGHASLRITTREGKVIYIDPYVGSGYGPAADLILVTHSHSDHSAVSRVKNRNPDCRTITWKEALDGGHQTFDLGFVTVEAVEAGYNRNHDVSSCVGYVLTFSDGISVYISGDTSKTQQMPLLAEKEIDYAFFCCDGVYNMGLEEAAECAKLVGAKHNVPYHLVPPSDGYFDRERAEEFDAPNRLIVGENEEIDLI